jgi:hypothetical protein
MARRVRTRLTSESLAFCAFLRSFAHRRDWSDIQCGWFVDRQEPEEPPPAEHHYGQQEDTEGLDDLRQALADYDGAGMRRSVA